jgi:hypothetical protein
LLQFDAYIYTQFTQKNKSFCLVTDGPDDLVYTLRKECLLKRIRLPAYFDRFFDLCKEFNKFYPEYGAKSLMDMAQCLGVARKTASTGMENCKIISNIIASVLREGYAFLEPVVIRVTFDPFTALLPVATVVETGAVPANESATFPLSTNWPPPSSATATATAPTTAMTSPAPSVSAVSASGDWPDQPNRAATSPLSYKGAVSKQRAPQRHPSNTTDHLVVADSALLVTSSAEDSPAVRLRGLPWGTKEEEVMARSGVEWSGGVC